MSWYGWLQSLDENAVAESKDAPVVVRKTRQAPAAPAAKDEEYEDDDQSAAATGGNPCHLNFNFIIRTKM